jgi:hypothetical protein
VETKGVQEALEYIHAHQNAEGSSHEHEPREEGASSYLRDSTSFVATHCPGLRQNVIQEHECELGMCQRQGPEAQVGGGVGYTPEHKLDSLNHLVDECLPNAVGVVLVKFVLNVENLFPDLLVLLVVIFKCTSCLLIFFLS